MNNIVDGHLDLSDLKYIQLSKSKLECLLLTDGDILINRTNSKELVGKSAVFHAKEQFVFASYIIRVRTDKKKCTPDFLTYVINSTIGRQQINALSRQIIGQANINSKELRSLRIPLPFLEVQQKIMRNIDEGLSEINRERLLIQKLTKEIEVEIKNLILGM